MTIGNSNIKSPDTIKKFNAALLKLPDTQMSNQVEGMLNILEQYQNEIYEKGKRLIALDDEIKSLCKRLENIQ